ncbi:hypothetical protein CHS0354_034459, partial [Potamilus streckersoni]
MNYIICHGARQNKLNDDGYVNTNCLNPSSRVLKDLSFTLELPFKANYDCMTKAKDSENYSKCLSHAIEANPIGAYKTISC